MAESLVERFGVDRDVVALVGAGGKTTLAFAIGEELRRGGKRAIVTTTTRLGADQSGGFRVVVPDRDGIRSALDYTGACLVVAAREGHKATGVTPEWVDEIWPTGLADAVVVEADGARRRLVKAPADHEPVIPRSASLVIAVVAAAAIGSRIDRVAHRPELVAAVVGASPSDPLTPEDVAALMASPSGGRKSVPKAARFVVAVTGVTAGLTGAARRVAELLHPTPAVLLPRLPQAAD